MHQLDPSKLSGPYGLVVLPDAETCAIAKKESANRMPNKAAYSLENEQPHLTLYHGNIINMPLFEALQVRQDVAKILQGSEIELYDIEVYADKFLFWNAEHRPLEESPLQKAHYLAAGVLSSYLNREAEPSAQKEKLKLTDAEEKNVAEFGHPLVGDLYKPHITLGYDRRGIKNVEGNYLRYMIADRIALVKMGDHGRIEKVVAGMAK